MRHATQRNVLYAFACDGEIKYIGKSKMSLAARMSGYRNPATSQTTNVRNNKRITEALASGGAVDIYALPDNGLFHYGQFHLNLAAGLEDDLIAIINPPWNGGKKEITAEGPEDIVPVEVAFSGTLPIDPHSVPETVSPDGLSAANQQGPVEIPIQSADLVRSGAHTEFTLVLHPTYHRTGFFNVGVAAEMLFGRDGEVIEIFTEAATKPILGSINRTANRNATPRIMGGTGLRDWFQSAARSMHNITVQVLSPTAIRLRAAQTSNG
jgi:hypothetical protein